MDKWIQEFVATPAAHRQTYLRNKLDEARRLLQERSRDNYTNRELYQLNFIYAQVADLLQDQHHREAEKTLLFRKIDQHYSHETPRGCTRYNDFGNFWLCSHICSEHNKFPTYDLQYEVADKIHISDNTFIYRWENWHEVFNTIEIEDVHVEIDESIQIENEIIEIEDDVNEYINEDNEAEYANSSKNRPLSTMPIQVDEISSTTN